MNSARKFWEKQQPTVTCMLLNSQADQVSALEQEEIIRYLPDLKGGEILELGSGIGRYTSHFATNCDHLTSIDLVPQFVEKNRLTHSHFQNIDFLCSDVMNLSFEEHSFDFIFMNWLFMYLEDDEVSLLIIRIHSWLKPQGQFFFRESCALVRSKAKLHGYSAHYRTARQLEGFLKKFAILKEDYIKTYVDFFADPMQLYWLCKKN